MHPFYEQPENNFELFMGQATHVAPHLHQAVECVYVTEGTLELGIGMEFYHMKKQDFAIVFPELIHHYQVFHPTSCKAAYFLFSSFSTNSYLPALQQSCPENPVIPATELHPDIIYLLERLMQSYPNNETNEIYQAYLQIILARALPHFQLTDKNFFQYDDIIYKSVSYIARNFKNNLSLEQMSQELGYSASSLSRVFSKTFHTNFNQYLNNIRLEYACSLLKHTQQSIIEISENAGFNSLRTFNRTFKDAYHITPRDYRISKH